MSFFAWKTLTWIHQYDFNWLWQVNISLFEVSGSDEYADLRKLLYPGTHLIIFCVGIDDHYLTKTKSRVDSWYKEFKQYCPGIPIFVVGTKKDIRDDVDGLLALAEKRVKPMKASDLSQLCKKFKGVAVLECSAKSGDGIEQVFHTAIKVLRHAK